LIADDHASVMRSVSELLKEWGYTIVATTSDGTEDAEARGTPSRRGARRPAHARKLRHRDRTRGRPKKGSVPVLIYTGFNDQAFLSEALDSGARGFILKEAPLDDLRRALAVVIAGGTYIDPVLSAPCSATPPAHGSPSEREVLRFLAEGCSNEEIGNRLFISSETVRTQVGKSDAQAWRPDTHPGRRQRAALGSDHVTSPPFEDESTQSQQWLLQSPDGKREAGYEKLLRCGMRCSARAGSAAWWQERWQGQARKSFCCFVRRRWSSTAGE
jgi:DNA-binding NarL/FixJ family response regulator